MELFNPFLYYRVHYLIVLLLSLFVFFRINQYSADKLLNNKRTDFVIWLYVILFIIVVGLRPVSRAFGDMGAYARMFRNFSEGDVWDLPTGDTPFFLLEYWCAQRMDAQWFFLIVEIIYILPVLVACWRFFKKNDYIAILFCIAAFSFFTYGVNGIRNGAACSLVILAISFIQGGLGEKILCAVFSLIAINFHHSTALPVLGMIVAYLVKSPRIMFVFWVFSIIVSLIAGDYVSNLFAGLGFDDRLSDYIVTEAEEDLFSYTGFRWDFLLYSAIPVIMGYYIIFRKKVFDPTYLLLLGTYIYANSFWIMVIRANYSNRFAYLSWFLYPLVLAYPLLKLEIWPKTQGHKTGLIMLGHLAFTLMMIFIF